MDALLSKDRGVGEERGEREERKEEKGEKEHTHTHTRAALRNILSKATSDHISSFSMGGVRRNIWIGILKNETSN